MITLTTSLLVAAFMLQQVSLATATDVVDPYSRGPWRISLDSEDACWTTTDPVARCERVLTTAHGGEWNITFPYDSLPAFQKAYEDGADAVKGDFRVSKDNIGVVMHSSPVEWYESPDCRGRRIEEMTAAECTQCHMEITDFTFITVPQLLSWAEGKVNVMLCVKESSDIARAISTLIEQNATHRAFLEVHVSDLLQLEVDAVAGWDQVYYVAELKSPADLDSMLAASEIMRQRAFLIEFSGWEDWDGGFADDITALGIAPAEAAGYRTFAPTHNNALTATVENHLRLFELGFDVAYTYNLRNAVEARRITNLRSGILPP